MPALYRGPKRGYTLTDYDKLVLAISIWGEAGSNPSEEDAGAVAWSMLMRFLLLDMKWSQEGWNLASFIRAFSAPVNPRWLDPQGSKCQHNPSNCTPTMLARRAKFQAYLDDYDVKEGWERAQYSAPVPCKYAQAFQDGDLPNPFPEPIYDFAACFLTEKQVAAGSRPSAGLNIGNNCFLRYTDLNASEKSRVIPGKVSLGAEAHTSDLSLGLGAVFILGLATAWWLSR